MLGVSCRGRDPQDEASPFYENDTVVPADVRKFTLGKQREWRGTKWQDQQSLPVGHVVCNGLLDKY